MKQKILLLLLLASVFFSNAKANESEPNDTRAQANTLPLNGNNSGDINPSADVDWFKVTTTSDGQLNLTLTSTNGINVQAYLYDNDGATLLNNGVTAGTININTDGLAAGTYYIRISTYYTGQTPAYTISNTLTVASVANDAEPDSSRATALTLPLNGTKTGHEGYYYNNQRDLLDFYKITTNGDGLLQLKLTSNNGNNVQAVLYDNNGTTFLGTVVTSTTAYLNVDGLAAGTYYVQVGTYYTNQFAPYTITDSLFKAVQANDAEPDSSKATAITLPLNSTKTGHEGYYYNNQRDLLDFYKITTDGDGLIQLKLSSGNGNNVQAILYDNDGTTSLGNVVTASTAYLNVDGLSAGTYYVQIGTYYTNQFAPYTITDSLFKPAQANDAEPDSTKATALTLAVNSTTTGHIDYYYKNHRDLIDFYKITTTADGLIQLKLSSGNGYNVQATLYDNDGTTSLGNLVTASTAYLNVDGLSAGTYYVQINSYYSNQFEPYTLTDSLLTYTYTNDKEPNNTAHLAKTLPSNLTTYGHIDFYYNNQRDLIDWHKINYTGTSDLSITYNLQPNISDGGFRNVTFQVYKDTNAAPISNVTFASATTTVNLTGLSEGYYYIKVNPYYTNQFEAYSITPTFTQTDIAKLKVISKGSLANCADTSSIVVKPSGSHAPYTLQLYRFGMPYGDPVFVAGSKNVAFSGLPEGSYMVRAYGDGAAGTAFGKTPNIAFEPIPAGLSTTNIKATSATLNWDTLGCVGYFMIEYKVHGSNTWITKKPQGNVNSYVLKGLTANTTYDWSVAAFDSANKIIATGTYADSVTFTTAASLIAETGNADEDNLSIKNNNSSIAVSVAPNPANSYFIIHYNITSQQKLTATLFDMNGKAVWSSGTINTDALNGKQVMVNQFGSGLYYLKITNNMGAVVGDAKVSITR